MKPLKLLAACLLPALAVSCQKDPVPEPKPEPKVEVVELDHNIDDTRFDDHIAFLGSDCEYFAKFRSRGDVKDEKDASVIIIDQKSLEVFEEDVDKAFNDGKFIVVCDYNYNDFQPLQQEKGWLRAIPERENSELMGFSKYGILMLIDDDDVIEIKDPELTPDSDGKNTIPSEMQPADDNVIEEYVYKELDSLDGYIGAFVGEVNDLKNKYEKNPEIQSNVLYVNLLMKWKVKLLFAQTALSNWDYVEGTYLAATRYAIKPLYEFLRKSASPGDFYIMNVDYVSMPSDVWKGDDQIRTHGAVDVHYTGAFVREFKAETSISSSNVSIISGTGPYPETFVGTSTYEKSVTWRADGGITAGLTFPDTKISAGAQFSWGTTDTRSIKINKNDWEIKQTTLESKPSWEWVSQNLPKKSGPRHFTRKCPPIACGTAILPAHWIWRYSGGPIGEKSKTSIGDLVTKVHPKLGIQRNGFWYSYEEYVYDIKEKTVTIKMPVPQRVPFGTFLLHNGFKEGTIISGITVKNGKDTLFISKGDFRYGKDCEVSVEEGEYDVYFTTWDGPSKTDYKSIAKIKVDRRNKKEDTTVYEASGSRFSPIPQSPTM